MPEWYRIPIAGRISPPARRPGSFPQTYLPITNKYAAEVSSMKIAAPNV